MSTKYKYNPIEDKWDLVKDNVPPFFPQSAQTTDGTPTVVSGSLPVAEDSSINFKTRVAALQSAGGANDTAFFELLGTIKNIGGTTTISNVTKIDIQREAGAALWDFDAAANDSTDTLDITVTGEAAKTIEWKIETYYTEVTL